MKKIICLFIAICLVIGTVPSLAEEMEKTIPDTWKIIYGGGHKEQLFWAEINGDICTIMAVAQYSDDELIVPYKDSLYVKVDPVHSTIGDPLNVNTILIDKDALKRGAELVTTITFEEGYEGLPGNLCEGFQNLKTVNLPESMYVIGNSCFKDCTMLENINLEGVQYIGTDAFLGTKVDLNKEDAEEEDYIYLAKETFVNQHNIINLSVEALSWYDGDSETYDFTTLDADTINTVLNVINACRYKEVNGNFSADGVSFLIKAEYSDKTEVSEVFKLSTERIDDKKYQLLEEDYWKLEECIKTIKKNIAGTFSDIATDSEYYEAIKVLSELGIMEGYDDGTFKPDETLTRAEAAAIIVRLLNLEINLAGAETSFSDVESTHWASGYINWAAENGIINGQGDGTFAPDEKVTYQQMIKMLVCALGYEPMAVYNGGWNGGGYVFAASRCGLINGIPGILSENITREKAARLIYNALTIDLMEQTSDGWIREGIFAVLEDRNILTEYWNYQKIECEVKKIDSSTVIKITKNYDSEPLYIEGQLVTFETNDEGIRELVGSSVTAYVKKITDGTNIILFTNLTTK